MGNTTNWEDVFADYFGFARRKNKQSTSNTSQQTRPKKIDFSEIIALENKIMEQKAILENMEEEISNYDDKIKQEKEKIEEEIKKLRKEKTSEEGYLKALQYIEKFRKRDAIPIINLTITEKQVNLYQQCVDIISAVEKQLDDLKKARKKIE